MDERFSKKMVAKRLRDWVESYERTYGFTSRTGFSQVQGKGEQVNRHYGEYACILHMLDSFDLNRVEQD